MTDVQCSMLLSVCDYTVTCLQLVCINLYVRQVRGCFHVCSHQRWVRVLIPVAPQSTQHISNVLSDLICGLQSMHTHTHTHTHTTYTYTTQNMSSHMSTV